MKRLLYIIVLMLIPFTVLAQQLGDDKATAEAQSKDSVVVSLLTCTPGQLVYELYGHTAIRVKEVGARQSDWVFNYGTFSFNQPHFVWRFMLGAREADTAASPKAKVSVRSVVLSFPSAVSNVLAMSRGVAQAKVATLSTPMRTSR